MVGRIREGKMDGLGSVGGGRTERRPVIWEDGGRGDGPGLGGEGTERRLFDFSACSMRFRSRSLRWGRDRR